MDRVFARAGLVVGVLTVSGLGLAPSAFAKTNGGGGTTWVVDSGNPSCSDSGPGTSTTPFCTIGKGASVALAGDTVLVNPGTYSGVISPARSGAAGSPITFQANGSGVTLTGGASQFKISSRSWITVAGFTVTNTSADGIAVTSSTNVVISGNTVSYAGQPVSGYIKRGIKLSASSSVTISGNTTHHNTDAGIYLDGTTNNVTVDHNVSYANARQYTRAAPGIDVRGYSNTITANISHDNEDSGVQFYTGSHDNLAADNVAYDNGDHGIDDLGATNQRIIANTVYGNLTAGINAEGGSTGAVIRNNISVDNGTPSSPRTKGDIRVDANSISGSVVDDNLVWQDTAGAALYTWGTTLYTTLAAFQSASGQESQGIAAAPGFADAAGGDFHLTAGSPAIDTADTTVSGQPSADLDGKSPHDDRGAYEF